MIIPHCEQMSRRLALRLAEGPVLRGKRPVPPQDLPHESAANAPPARGGSAVSVSSANQAIRPA
jgi:hypothetical protein